MEWLDKELSGKQFIAGGDYSVADITAQCAFVMAKAALGLRIPEELTNLSDWWARVSTRPTARA
jgi:glutathione S-transferase